MQFVLQNVGLKKESAIPDGGGTFQTAFSPGVGIPHYRPGIPTKGSTLSLRVISANTCEDLSIASLFWIAPLL